jgi:uncharacterized protein (TIRG00374 family)
LKSGWRATLGLVLSGALIYLTLRGISPSEVARRLSDADPLLFLASIFCATAIFGLRARRWQTILEPCVDRVPLGPLWRATAIGMMVNNVVPARAGEVARAYALTKDAAVPFPAALASLVVDRLFDAIVLMILAAIALLDPALSTGETFAGRPLSSFAYGAGAIVVLLVVALYLLVYFPAQLLGFFGFLTGRISAAVEVRARRILETFIAGLSVLRSPGRFAAVLGWTLAHWILNAIGFWLAFRAVGITAPFSAALFLQAFIALGTAVPALPGFFGVFEYMSVQALAVYGVGQQQAATWAIGFHILSFIPITLIGAYYFTRLGVRMSELRATAEASG